MCSIFEISLKEKIVFLLNYIEENEKYISGYNQMNLPQFIKSINIFIEKKEKIMKKIINSKSTIMEDKDIKTMSKIIQSLTNIAINLSSLKNLFEEDIDKKGYVLFGVRSPAYIYKKNIEECIKKEKNEKKDMKRRYSFIYKFTSLK